MLPTTATPFEVTVDVISDILTSIAYFSIPLELIYFLKYFPTKIPKRYKSIIIMFALFIVLCGLTHLFNALRFGIGTMLCTKMSTAIISLLTASVLFVLIPGVLQFVNYTKTLEEEILIEPHPSTNAEVKDYLEKRRSSIRPRFADVVYRVLDDQYQLQQRNLIH